LVAARRAHAEDAKVIPTARNPEPLIRNLALELAPVPVNLIATDA
jgi:hypothetical protein